MKKKKESKGDCRKVDGRRVVKEKEKETEE